MEPSVLTIEQVPDSGGAATKYQQIAACLGQTAAAAVPGSRLPTLRELAGHFGTTVPTVQRAVRELAAEGVLETRPRAGVFVGRQRPTTATGQSSPMLFKPTVRRLRLAVQSYMPFYRRFWMAALAAFSREHRFLEADLVSLTASRPHAGLTIPPGVDMVEGPLYDPAVRACARPLLAPPEPISWLPRRGSTTSDTPPTCCGVHVHPAVLLINRDRARDWGLRVPAGETFADQETALRAAFAAEGRGRECGALSILGTVASLGRLPNRLLDSLGGGDLTPAARAALERDLDRALELYHLLWQRFAPYVEGRADIFLAGGVPFYLTAGFEVPGILERNPGFEIEVRPWLSVDNSLFCMVGGLGVSATSAYPIESMRLLRHLRSEPMQRLMAGHGMVPVDSRAWDALPKTTYGSARWQRALQRLTTIVPTTAEEAYICNNLLTDELWAAAEHHRTAAEVLANIFRFGRGYLGIGASSDHSHGGGS